MMVRTVAVHCTLLAAIWFFFAKKSSFARLSWNDAVAVQTAPQDKFSWDAIVPSEKLVWTDCYTDKQCARLKVPLDYANPDAGFAAIAMARLHSAVSHNSSAYRGPVLINPGGPGGSGVDMLLSRGSLLSVILGPEFDIIGFDPRGIARSTPRVSYFESRAEREIFNLGDLESLNASTGSLARGWARGMLVGGLAGERDDGSLRFINTDHTARDMLRIVQAHGRDKIQYWGFSYGSILGATFAAMFPEHVERLVIDGVMRADNYYATEWSLNLLDTDKAWQSFAHGCAAAGAQGCAFYSPTAAEITANIDKISASLRARPIPVRTSTAYGLVDYSMLRTKIFRSLYAPYAMFPALAQALADLAAGNGTTLFNLIPKTPFECACDASEYQFESVDEAGSAVYCNDGKRISPAYEDLLAHYQTMSETSSFAFQWELIRTSCLAWPEFPKNHFHGPFVANTSFPVLLVGNTADPVTPLSHAMKMSRGFADSVVLTQDSVGHCSISGPSLCTQKHIRAYFFDGALPPPGTVCPVDAQPFPANDAQPDAGAQAVLRLSAADRNLLEAVRELAATFDIRFPAGL